MKRSSSERTHALQEGREERRGNAGQKAFPVRPPPSGVDFVDRNLPTPPLQLQRIGDGELPSGVRDTAARGLVGAGQRLPYLERIQASFGPKYDLTNAKAHLDSHASDAAERLGAVAYTSQGRIAFASEPSLHTAAHEAAHIVQQQAGARPEGGVGMVEDPLERHADRVAERVVRGLSAEEVIDPVLGPASRNAVFGTLRGIGLQMKKGSRLELTGVRPLEGEDLVVLVFRTEDGSEHTEDIPASKVRAYLINTHNVTGITNLMRKLHQQELETHQAGSLAGRQEDDLVIMPFSGIAALVRRWADEVFAGRYRKAEVRAKVRQFHKKARQGAINRVEMAIMGAKSMNEFMQNRPDEPLQDEAGRPLQVPSFDRLQYSDYKRIVLASGGMWSDAPNVINMVGIRNEAERLEQKTKWNDIIAVCWIDSGGEPQTKQFTGTTEQGNRMKHTQLVPQTVMVRRGYHKSSQPALRTRGIIYKKPGKSRETVFVRKGGYNIHKGGGHMKFKAQKPLKLPNVEWFTRLDSYMELHANLVEMFHLLGKTRGEVRFTDKKSAYNNLVATSRSSRMEEQVKREAAQDVARIDELLMESESPLAELRERAKEKEKTKASMKLTFDELQRYIKKTVTVLPQKEERGLAGATSEGGFEEIQSEVVGGYSHGCQVIFGPGQYYEFAMELNKRASESGQLRWYYTLVNSRMLTPTLTESGEVSSGQ